MPQVVRVQEKGQVTIPLEIRQKFGLKKGVLVTFVETEQGIVIKLAEVIVTETLDKIGQVLKEKGISPEELIEQGRRIRGELIKKEYGLGNREKMKKSRIRKELFDSIRKVQRRNKGVDPDEVMRTALEAQQAVRSKKES